jgi:hypothetical protein
MQSFTKAYIVAAMTHAALSHVSPLLRFILSLGEMLRWSLTRK